MVQKKYELKNRVFLHMMKKIERVVVGLQRDSRVNQFQVKVSRCGKQIEPFAFTHLETRPNEHYLIPGHEL